MTPRRGQLQLLPAPEDRDRVGAEGQGAGGGPSTSRGRRLAPGAPPSPGTVPLELARELRVGEPVIWWGHKDHIDRRPIVWVAIVGVLMLGLATLLAPELWDQPLADMWKPLVPALAPAALLAARQWLSLRAVLVTDSSLVVRDHRGRLDRLAFRNVRRVGRDLLTGGILLEGARHKLRVPPELEQDARAAIASQTRHTLQGGDGPDDPLGWLG
ncbi:hypothetical protein ENSA5_16020 [Enhygromyxa salina]|uniref:Uncharacterized protein n=1 Tax=Enhygromyxa salina TaxID=215803 RepID=A0A2S9YEF4_9BACT|nr:hypothetical protein [Enhygromyxa salina]PRQ03396.1 hypothetical protein ENSA5_16020 [Enhygromyxa salina]